MCLCGEKLSTTTQIREKFVKFVDKFPMCLCAYVVKNYPRTQKFVKIREIRG
jgi:hypothetical protein